MDVNYGECISSQLNYGRHPFCGGHNVLWGLHMDVCRRENIDKFWK
jgi:hypothetical protein